MMRGLLLTALLVAAACTPKLLPPPFVKSPAFAQVQRHAFGIARAPLNAQGQPAAVAVALRDTVGKLRLAVFQPEPDTHAPRWRERCRAQPQRGETVAGIGWFERAQGPLLLLVTVTRDPDTAHYATQVVTGDCERLFVEELKLPNFGGTLLAPPGIALGPSWHDDALWIVDQPEVTELAVDSEAIPVVLLRGARVRQFHFAGAAQDKTTGLPDLLQPLPLVASWHPKTGGAAQQFAFDGTVDGVAGAFGENEAEQPAAAAPVTDAAPGVALRVASHEQGVLRLRAEEPIVQLLVEHGCGPGPQPIVLVQQGGLRHVLGHAAMGDSFVRWAGRRAAGRDGLVQDVLLLAEPASLVELDVAQRDRPWCLHRVTALGWCLSSPINQQPSPTASIESRGQRR